MPVERDRDERAGFLLYEGISRPGEDSTHSRIDVPYRVDHEFFVPVKNNDTSIHWPFVRRGEVAIDLIDSLGVSRARGITQVLIGQNSSERSPGLKQWYQGVSSFVVPPGPYTIQIEVTDLESQHNVLEKQERVRAQDFTSPLVQLSTPVFVQGEPLSRFPDTLTLQNLGGSLLFGDPGALFFLVYPGNVSDTALRVSWTIKQIGGDRKEQDEVAHDSSARIVTIRRMLVDSVDAENGVRYPVHTGASSHVTGVLVPLPAEQLRLRLFTIDLNILLGSHEEHRVITFRTVWPTMPFSLRDVDLALDALRFIVSPDRLDSLKEGTFTERREHLETFWKFRDRTPGTARNELMAEYYRRVDYAMRNFGTLRVPDGSRTDRGKIFILYGPPTSMDRSLDPVAGFQETWIYEKLGKRFVFKDQSKSGNYLLSPSNGS
jgi:GWxTD domain-containing protein